MLLLFGRSIFFFLSASFLDVRRSQRCRAAVDLFRSIAKSVESSLFLRSFFFSRVRARPPPPPTFFFFKVKFVSSFIVRALWRQSYERPFFTPFPSSLLAAVVPLQLWRGVHLFSRRYGQASGCSFSLSTVPAHSSLRAGLLRMGHCLY